MTGVIRHPRGPRVYVAGLRIHHGSAGLAAALVGLAVGSPPLVIAAVVAVAHDGADFPWRDCDNH